MVRYTTAMDLQEKITNGRSTLPPDEVQTALKQLYMFMLAPATICDVFMVLLV